MSDEIRTTLDELRLDHKNMTVLLNLLEKQTEKVYKTESADFGLMLDIMHYMTVYPDTVHHPKEDLLYAELRAARPDLSEGLSHVADEHRTIAEQSLLLRDKLEQIEAGDMVKRNSVVADAARYVDSLRRHMRWEETDLFRRLDQMVADGHTVADQARIVHHHDPLFGPEVKDRFKHVLESIEHAQ